MTENEFNELWMQAEAQHYGRQLAQAYPEWRQGRSRITRVATMFVAFVLVAAALIVALSRQPRDYDKVYCNRAGTADAQWVSLASDMLLE